MTQHLTPQDFIAKWGPGGPAFDLNERQGAQQHFVDLCNLLGVATPSSSPDGDYIFEQGTLLLGEARGYADVFKRGYFAWENKAPHRNLDAALKQLLGYSLALSNPPLLVVCDRLTIRIHTQFTGHPSEVHTVQLQELDAPEKRALLKHVWDNPEWFRPKKTTRDITEAAAHSFAKLAEQLRSRGKKADAQGVMSGGTDPEVVAHFLTQCLFCFFAEDVDLLPRRMFEGLVNNRNLTSDKFALMLTNLFTAMRDGGLYGNDAIPWFNGGLFKKIQVPALTVMDVTELRNAAALNWTAIDVSIFGTLFERGLDPKKRSQLGAHYTDPATILRIIDPVIRRPLLQIWEQSKQEISQLLAKSKLKKRVAYSAGGRQFKATAGDAAFQKAEQLFVNWLDRLKNYRILDPACGSGNFLFLGLKVLKDIEHQSHLEAATLGLDREADLVTGPHNMLGLELNEYAAELARVTVWIGELQWRLTHGYEFKTNPVLEPLDHIECRDALITFPTVRPELVEGSSEVQVSADSEARAGQRPGAHDPSAPKSHPTSAPPTPRSDLSVDAVVGSPSVLTVPVEATWPKASVVVGNPPFLGDKKMRSELGDAYTETLRKVYAGRVPGGADLVTYWFEKARTALEKHGLGAAGLVTTQSIRAGAGRKVLARICETSRIYEAWSDLPWVNDGASVRVSLICFGWGGNGCILDGKHVPSITADLGGESGNDLTTALPLLANKAACFIGGMKKGAFDISGKAARHWLRLPNPNGKSNAEVIKPWINGLDITRRHLDQWIVDFGLNMEKDDASLYEAPFTHVLQTVYPQRKTVRNELEKRNWWLHARPAPDLREGIEGLKRVIVTPRVAKHRFFVWVNTPISLDGRLVVIARLDDTTFGILTSHIHEVWSLAQASMHGDGDEGGRPTYNARSCFETFPFPAGLTPQDTASQQTRTLASGAVVPVLSVRPEPVEGSLKASTSSARTGGDAARTGAEAIAEAAYKLNALRENWLNPPEWTQRLPEVVPLGMTASPYPDRIVPKPGHEKELSERTLTKLYNARPAWLAAAHAALDAAVATAYGWADYTPDMPDETILQRLLALNVERSQSNAKA